MGCDCKKRNKIVGLLTNQETTGPEGKVSDMWKMILKPMLNGLARLVIILTILIFIPIVIIGLCINYLIKGDFNIVVPKILQKFVPKDE